MKSNEISELSPDNADQIFSLINILFFKLLLPSILINGARSLEKKYVLNREFNGKGYKTIDLPPEVIREHLEINRARIMMLEHGEDVLRFADTLIEKMPNENLNCLYNNLNSLIVSDSKMKLYNFLFSSHASAIYRANRNIINADWEKDPMSIFHELFHMSSTKYFKQMKRIFCGFLQTIHSSKSIGRAINEGYTEHLSFRYFGGEDDTKIAYNDQVKYARFIEQMVGKDKMESLYLKADLNGLIQELRQYSDEKSAINFIENGDFILKYQKLFVFKNTKEMVISKLRDVSIFLAKVYANKLIVDQQKDPKSISELTEEIRSKVTRIPTVSFINLEDYRYIEYEELINIITDILRQANIEVPDINIGNRLNREEVDSQVNEESSISR